MNAYWYPGRYSLNLLTIFRTAISVIEANAFDSLAFRKLHTLRILMNVMHIQTYRPEMLSGLHYLHQLIIYEASNPTAFPVNFLAKIRMHLNHFAHFGFVLNSQSLTNLFGHQRLRIEMLDIDCNGVVGNTDFLARANFSALLLVKDLSVKDCGVEYIEPGTFDGMLRTLRYLHLVHNPFKRLDANAFTTYLDVPGPVILHISSKEHPIECSMEFYELRNMSVISIGQGIGRTLAFCVGSLRSEANWQPLRQRQSVHGARWHLDSIFYRFPKFILKFDASHGREVMVRQPINEPYRLLIWHIKRAMAQGEKPYCPVMTDIYHCHRRHNRTETFALADDAVEFTIACVILMPSAYKKAIPLHCITIRHLPTTHGWQLFVLISVLNVIVAVAVVLIYLLTCRGAATIDEKDDSTQYVQISMIYCHFLPNILL